MDILHNEYLKSLSLPPQGYTPMTCPPGKHNTEEDE